jgi:hypothetical protein
VIRDKRYKVWVDERARITRLHDLVKDPAEQANLIGSQAAPHLEVVREFQAVIDAMPSQDVRPRYTPRGPNPWDRTLDAAR